MVSSRYFLKLYTTARNTAEVNTEVGLAKSRPRGLQKLPSSSILLSAMK